MVRTQVIAVWTFRGLWMQRQITSKWFTLFTITGIWLFISVMAIAVKVAHPNILAPTPVSHFNLFCSEIWYHIAVLVLDPWLSCLEDFQWISMDVDCASCFFGGIYSTLFLDARDLCRSQSSMVERYPSIPWPPDQIWDGGTPAGFYYGCVSPSLRQCRTKYLWRPLRYPFLYAICILPLSIVRWIAFVQEHNGGTNNVPSAATLTVISLFQLSGLFNVILLITTKPNIGLFGNHPPPIPAGPQPLQVLGPMPVPQIAGAPLIGIP